MKEWKNEREEKKKKEQRESERAREREREREREGGGSTRALTDLRACPGSKMQIWHSILCAVRRSRLGIPT